MAEQAPEKEWQEWQQDGYEPFAVHSVPFPVPALPWTNPAPVSFNHSNDSNGNYICIVIHMDSNLLSMCMTMHMI